MRLAVDRGLPVAVHTGQLAGPAHPKTNVKRFASILEAYPKVRFDLYHLNYPWFDDLVAVLKQFPNAWANCCWTHMIDPAGTVRFLQRALGAVPANHVFGFGGDFVNLPEPVCAHLDMARDNLASALAEAVACKWCSRQGALELARMWLFENPTAFYDV